MWFVYNTHASTINKTIMLHEDMKTPYLFVQDLLYLVRLVLHRWWSIPPQQYIYFCPTQQNILEIPGLMVERSLTVQAPGKTRSLGIKATN